MSNWRDRISYYTQSKVFFPTWEEGGKKCSCKKTVRTLFIEGHAFGPYKIVLTTRGGTPSYSLHAMKQEAPATPLREAPEAYWKSERSGMSHVEFEAELTRLMGGPAEAREAYFALIGA